MKKIHLLLALALAGLIGCDKDSKITETHNLYESDKVVVIRERDPDYPFTDYSAMPTTCNNIHVVPTGELNFKDFLGRSFKTEYYPFESARNIGFPVIALDKFLNDYKFMYQSVPIKESNISYYSFADFERYETKSKIQNIVNKGFQLNCLLFKIGTKKKYTEIFKLSLSNANECAYGELNIKFCDRKYELFIPNNMKDILFSKYLHSDFIRQTYYSTPLELMKNYGGFILTKFMSGGKAIAMFKSEKATATSETERETGMDSEISASIISKSSDNNDSNDDPTSADIQLGIGRTTEKFESISSTFSKMQFSVCTIGGLSPYTQFTVAKELCAPVINLSGWSNSLGYETNLAIAELIDDSLIPIVEAIEEENIREQMIKLYSSDITLTSQSFEEPTIVFSYRRIYGGTQYYTDLRTRYNNLILLRTLFVPDSDPMQYYDEEIARLDNIFPHLAIEYSPTLGAIFPESFRHEETSQFDTSLMSKYVDPESGKTYLLTQETLTGEKLAYTVYDRTIINDYGLAELIESLPVANINDKMEIRASYRIIAL